MNIGLVSDTFAVEEGTGIARYSFELLTGLSREGLNVRPLRYSPANLPLGSIINHALRMPYSISRQAGNFDLIHATSPICALSFPWVRATKIVTYHDLTSLLSKDVSAAFHTRLFAPLFLRIGRFADKIIANSSQTKKEIMAHLGISGEKIAVINLGISTRFEPIEMGPRDKYTIGYVGALGRRKRLDILLRAFTLVRERHRGGSLKLAICGSKRLEYPALVRMAEELNVAEDVEFRGFVADQALRQTYNSFDVFVLPSEWEGFGLPVLEAQRCGVPVVICAGAHIPPEVAAACLKASTEMDMAEKILQLLTNSDLRSATIEKGLEHSRQFTWEKMVESTLALYEEAMFA